MLLLNVEVREEEQQAYLKNPQERNYDLNSALVITQRLIIKQVIK